MRAYSSSSSVYRGLGCRRLNSLFSILDASSGAIYYTGDMKLQALVFDAYGTLFDVHSVAALCEELWPGKGEIITRTWRAKQLEYTWQRSLMRRYQDFKRVTDSGLRYACAAAGVPLADAQLVRLMEAYLHLSPFPEVGEALSALRQSKLRLAILSNGSP